jgi:hypothetical protein
MRLTANGLRKLIKEEYSRVLRESAHLADMENDISQLEEPDYMIYQWITDAPSTTGGLDLGDYAAKLEEELNYVDDDADEAAIEADLAAIDAGTFSLETRQFDLDYEEPEMEDAGGPFYTVLAAGGGFIVEQGDPEGDDFEPYSHLKRYDVANQSTVLGSETEPASLADVMQFFNDEFAKLTTSHGPGYFEDKS